MSNVENNVNENNDEISAEESEAAKNVDLRAIGIEPSSTPIPDLLKFYREAVEVVKSFTTKAKEGTTDPDSVDSIVKNRVSKVLKCDGTSEEVTTQVRSLRDAIQNSVTQPIFEKSGATSNLIASAVVLDEMRNLLSMLEDEYAYHLNKSIQSEKDAKGITHTPSETAVTAKLTAIALKKLLEVRINQDKIMPELDPNYVATMPDNLYRTEGTRKGFNTDVFPRLPRLDVEGGTVGTQSTHLEFEWNGEAVSETTLNDVAHNHISKGSYRVTGKQVHQDLRKAGHGIGATNEWWTLEYKTGTLKGRKAS